MASSFDQVRKKQLELAEDLYVYSGVDKDLALKVIQYAQTLTEPGYPNVISEKVFKAQMGHRFGINSKFHLQCTYEAVKRRVGKSGIITVAEYAKLLCMFYSNKLDLKIEFVFNVYDIDTDGIICFKECRQLLRTSILTLEEDPTNDEPLKELIDIVMSVLDRNKDGEICLDEYRSYVKDNILFLQLLGQVLPGDYELRDFMDTLRRMSMTHIKSYFRHERRLCLNAPPQLESRQQLNFKELYPVHLDFVDFM